jgi:hypothetical protein
MGQWAHGGGFSVNGSVRIEAERQNRYMSKKICEFASR